MPLHFPFRLRSLGVALLLFVLCAPRANAQTDTVATPIPADVMGYVPRPNLIKIGLTSSIAKVASVMYERVLNPDLSVALTVSYMTPVYPPAILDLHPTNLTLSSDRKLSGWFVTPEVKWFLETSDDRPAPRGLYLGGYLRFSNLRYTADLAGKSANENVDGMVNTHLQIDLFESGIGPEVGYQFLALHDRLVFDALFFAPRFSFYKLRVKADLNGDGELGEDLGNAIEDALGRDIVNDNIDLSKTGSTTIDRNSFGYRYGIKIGYAF